MSNNHRANKRVSLILAVLHWPLRSRLLVLGISLLVFTALYWLFGRQNGLGLAAGLLAVVMAAGFFFGVLGGAWQPWCVLCMACFWSNWPRMDYHCNPWPTAVWPG
jgi:hypothetical protein